MQEADYSQAFHQSSKDLSKGHPPISSNIDDWPDTWKTVEYKAYPRLPKIVFPESDIPDKNLFTVICERHSVKDFSPTPVSLADLGRLLRFSCGTLHTVADGSKMSRAQPSGGGRYPIEVYPLVLRGSSALPVGLYHYNIKQHALDVLWEKNFSQQEIESLLVQESVARAGVILFLSAVFQRNQVKYGERGYRFILLEAGHIGQNVYLTAQALGLGCCALGGTHDSRIEELLDIDGVGESVVYALAIGHK